MSDGPYKSLPMRKAWRNVAELAHKEAFTPEERADAMCVALHDDIKRDVGKDALEAIGEILLDSEQGNLLASQASAELEAIRFCTRSSAFLECIIEQIQVVLHRGKSGEVALREGLERAAIDHAKSNNRSVEEHYYRDTPTKKGAEKALSVRDNLDATLKTDRVRSFASEVIQLMQGETFSAKIQKDTDVHSGPEIFS